MSLQEALKIAGGAGRRASGAAAEAVWDAPAEGRRKGAAITLRGVAKSFGERLVLRDIDLDIPAGSFVAVVGRSGCGKSTLLNLLAGLLPPSAGQIRLDGAAVKGLQPTVRMLFQDARLLPWHRVISNVGIARGPDWRRKAQAVLDDVGLGDRAQDWPSMLSGGQRQRVALARALVGRPQALLLDEPFGALDALTRAEMHELLLRIWDEHRMTSVLITHDVGEATALADRVLVLRDGGVALDAAVELPRPRRHGDPKAAALQARILGAV